MSQKRERGVALVMALFILIVIMMLGMVFTVMMASESNNAIRATHSIKSLYLADAGLQYAQYSTGNTTDWTTLDDVGSNSFSRLLNTEESFSVVFSDAYSGATDGVWASSWGYVYDALLGYSTQRLVTAQFKK